MNIDKLKSKIKEKFPYLFNEYGFRIVYAREFRFHHNLVGIESHKIRLLFEQERGGFCVFVGPLSASFDDDKKNEWVNIYSLIYYLRGREIDWNEVKKYPYSEQFDVVLSITSRELAAILERFIEMFDSPDAIAQWKTSYDRYVKGEVQRRLHKK